MWNRLPSQGRLLPPASLRVVANSSALPRRLFATSTITTGTQKAVPNEGTASKHYLKRSLQVGLGLFAVGFGVQYYNDEGTRRSVTFWRIAGPAYLHYRFIDYWTKTRSDDERSKAFNRLNEKYAPITEKVVLDLRGFYLKNAQFMSTVDFFIPAQYLKFCKRMQNEVPTEFAPGEAEDVVKRNLNIQSLDEVFSEFSSEPLGSASIGQVHLARLKENNQLVAVKIMGRGVEPRFRADIQTIIDFSRVAMPQHVAPMKEIQKQFVTEFDYRGEAQNLLDVRNNILPHFSDKVHVPMPYMKYCTKEVLVMEYIPGPTLIKGIRESYSKYAAKQGTTLEALEEQQREAMRRPDFKFRDINEEKRRMATYNTFVRCKDSVQNAFYGLYNYTVAPVFRLTPAEYVQSNLLLNLGEIIQLLAEVHAWEIMKDGAFSCDPHPGNVLLMPDGRLGLIDLGQFKRIPLESRVAFAKIVVALANDDQAEAVKLLRQVGVRTKYNNSKVCYKLAAFWFDRNTNDITDGRNIQQFMDDMEAEDPSEGLPEDLVMPGRVSVMMRAFGNAFGIDLSVAKLWEPVAKMVLKENKVDYVPKKSLATDYPSGKN